MYKHSSVVVVSYLLTSVSFSLKFDPRAACACVCGYQKIGIDQYVVSLGSELVIDEHTSIQLPRKASKHEIPLSSPSYVVHRHIPPRSPFGNTLKQSTSNYMSWALKTIPSA